MRRMDLVTSGQNQAAAVQARRTQEISNVNKTTTGRRRMEEELLVLLTESP